jgi:hypothetical protein
MVKAYFDKILEILLSYKKWVESVRIIECDITENDQKHVLIYRLRVEMKDGDLLEVMERICFSKKDGQINTTKYSFHWQNADRKLIRRWDNAPHHPEIQTHPYHVHENNEDNVKPSLQITALEMLCLIDMEKSAQSDKSG